MAKKILAENNNWMLWAECRGIENPDLFYVGDKISGSAYLAQVEAAKEYCGRCAVRLQCLDWALEIDESNTVMGGMTPGERRAHRRRGARANSE